MTDEVFAFYNQTTVTGGAIRWGDLSDKKLEDAAKSGNMYYEIYSKKVLEGRKERGIKK